MKAHKLEINYHHKWKTHQHFSSIVQMSAAAGPFALVLFCAVFLWNLLGYNQSETIGRLA